MKLREIIGQDGLMNAKVIAGLDGIHRQIDSISVLEVAESTISTWVVRNQLYITSFYAIKDDVQMQKIVIETLNKCGCCGLVICHLDMILKTISTEVADLCNVLHFPLIVAETHVSYMDILNPIIALLSGGVKRSEEDKAKTEFMDLLLEEKELPDILEKISFNIGHEISFFDVQCNCLYSNKGDLEKAEERDYLQEHVPWKNKNLSVLKYQIIENGKKAMLYYIKSKKNFFGVIILNFSEGERKEELLEIANNMNLVCALLFSRKRRLYNIEHTYKQEYIGDLLVWNFRSVDVAVNRGNELGLPMEDKKYIVVININAIQKTDDKKSHSELNHYIHHWFMPHIIEYASMYNSGSIVHSRSDVILLFLPDEKKKNSIANLTQRLLLLFEHNIKTTISIGVSNRIADIEGIPGAYNEAFDSAVLGREYCGENKIIYFKNIWFLHYIKQMRNQPEAEGMAEQILKPLYEFDQKKGTDLTHTLKVLLQCQMEQGAAAKRLFVHRNTILYRKNQITEILGYPAFEMPYIVNLMAAVVLKER